MLGNSSIVVLIFLIVLVFAPEINLDLRSLILLLLKESFDMLMGLLIMEFGIQMKLILILLVIVMQIGQEMLTTEKVQPKIISTLGTT